MKKSALALLIVMLFAADSTTAMSLGRYRGAALVGRPLDISIQAVLNLQDDPSALCIEADAFYADNKLDKSLVRVSTERTLSNPLDTNIRIRSSVLVDEPVVTLYVRVGCQQKTERRYVILADLASEPVGSPPPPAAGAGVYAGAGIVPVPLGKAAGSVAAASGVAPSISASPSVTSADAAPARRNKAQLVAALAGGSNGGSDPLPTGQATASKAPKEETLGVKRDRQRASDAGASGQSRVSKARLKLEPLDLSIEQEPQLKSSKEMLSVPTADVQQRLAAAALWRALMAQPQDIARDAEKIQALENSLSTLQAQTQTNQLTLSELNKQLEKTRSERYADWLVYVLGMLLLLALVGMVYMVRRLRTSSAVITANQLPWWRKNKPLDKGWAGSAADSAFPSSPYSISVESTDSSTVKKREKDTNKSAPAAMNSDSGLGADESAFTETQHISGLDGDSLLSPSSSLDFTVSMPHVARTVKAEELFDVQQQADFFVSLGQYEQAVDVLRGQIASSPQISPLVYLDLIKLYHQLDRQVDYEALRKDFNQLFTGAIPAFEFYTNRSAGLEAYPVALSRIEALWPSPKVLEIIEESILRRPAASADGFDLEAYRELLLLYAVAKELLYPEGDKGPGSLRFNSRNPPVQESNASTPSFSLTSIQPLPTITDEIGTKGIDPASPEQLSRLSQLPLDVNLVDLGAIANTPPSNVGAQSNSNSNFFARLGTKMPTGSPVRQPPPVAPDASPVKADNLINFDDFDDFFKNSDAAGPPKV